MFRIEEGTVTSFPVSELNRLNDLAKDLDQKEIDLKKERAKLEAEKELFYKEVEKESTIILKTTKQTTINRYEGFRTKTDIIEDIWSFKVLDAEIDDAISKKAKQIATEEIYTMLNEMTPREVKQWIKDR